jgi:hypothetical protein
MQRAGLHPERDAPEDLVILYGDVQVVDLEGGGSGRSHAVIVITLPP